MVIQTWTFLTDIPRQHPVAGTQLKQFIEQFYRILNCPRAGIWAKVPGSVLFHFSRKQYPRKLFSHRHFDKRISFIIFQQRIIFWAVLFDQIVFQYQCFQLGIRHNILKPCDLLYHLLDLRPSPVDLPEIGAHSVVQVHRFPHIEDRVHFIVHNVYAGFCREFF